MNNNVWTIMNKTMGKNNDIPGNVTKAIHTGIDWLYCEKENTIGI